MKTGLLYKHVNCRDVAMKVLKSYYIPEKQGWTCKVWWYNVVNPDNVFLMDERFDRVFVTKEQRANWKVYDALV